jgi:mannose-6-phosphate isomerase-like protein (cupin superfamily)
MTTGKGFVIPAGDGRHLDMGAPGRFAALKLLGHETNESVMLFEETVPVGTKSLFHLHRDSDEVAWVLAGEITFRIGDEVSVGGPGTCAFFPRMRGRAPAARPAESCSCTRRRRPAATSRRSWSGPTRR